MKKLLFLLLFPTVTFGQDFLKSPKDEPVGIALVLANEDYKIGKLKGVKEYGNKMGQALQARGFDVMLAYDLNYTQLLAKVEEFGKRIPGYPFAMMYYNGHGLQFDGEDYLIPTNFDMTESNPTIIKRTSLDFLSILELTAVKMDEKLFVPRLFIHDACRDNPIWENIYVDTKSSIGIGLKKAKLAANTVTVYSTYQDTKVTVDNPFTNLFIKNLKTEGCLTDIVRRTAKDVYLVNENQIVEPVGVILKGEPCFEGRKYQDNVTEEKRVIETQLVDLNKSISQKENRKDFDFFKSNNGTVNNGSSIIASTYANVQSLASSPKLDGLLNVDTSNLGVDKIKFETALNSILRTLDLDLKLKVVVYAQQYHDMFSRVIEFNPGVDSNVLFLSYDQMRSIANVNSSPTANLFYWMSLVQLSRQIGHFVFQHGDTKVDSSRAFKSKWMHLQADEYAGFVFAKLGIPLQYATSAYKNFNLVESAVYPGKQQRILAVQKGFIQGAQ